MTQHDESYVSDGAVGGYILTGRTEGRPPVDTSVDAILGDGPDEDDGDAGTDSTDASTDATTSGSDQEHHRVFAVASANVAPGVRVTRGFTAQHRIGAEPQNLSMECFKARFGFEPIQLSSNRLSKDLRFIVFCDGSGDTTAGSAGAGIVVLVAGTNTCFAIATSSPQSTNGVGEWTAMVGALTVAECLMEYGPVLVLGDNENVYTATTGRGQVHCDSTKRLHATAARKFKQLQLRGLVVGRMNGHIDRTEATYNLADHPARRSRRECRPIMFQTTCSDDGRQLMLPEECMTIRHTGFTLPDGEGTTITFPKKIFPEWSIKGTRRSALNLRKAFTNMPDRDAVEGSPPMTTFEQYCSLRTKPARTYVPHTIRPFWISLVRHSASAVKAAETEETRSAALLRFLELPHRWLPSKASTKRIEQRIRSGKAFSLQSPSVRARTAGRADAAAERLKRIIERKAKDFDLKGAIKVLRTQSTLEDMRDTDVEDKVKKLEAKNVEVKLVLRGGDLVACEDDPPATVLAEIERDLDLQPGPRASMDDLMKALQGMKRNAAQAIDGWCKGLLDFVVTWEKWRVQILLYLTSP